jgi:hypothetical protein
MKREIDQLEAALAEIALTRARLIDIEGHVTEALLSLRVRAQIDADEQRAAEIFQKRQERMQRLALGLFGSLAESAKNYINDHRPFDDGDMDEPEQPKQAEQPKQKPDAKQAEQPKQKPDAKGAKP